MRLDHDVDYLIFVMVKVFDRYQRIISSSVWRPRDGHLSSITGVLIQIDYFQDVADNHSI
jgi:hypothetical protein